MSASVDDGGNLHARILAAHVKGAYTLGTINLVGGDRHEIDVVLAHVDGNLSDSLYTIGVEQHTVLSTDLADFAPGLQYADFVVRRHDGHQDRLVINGAFQLFEIDQAIFLHGQVSDAIAIFLKTFAGIEHGFMFGYGRDDVIALLSIHLGDTFDGEVVALGGARGENDFLGSRANQFGNLLARILNGFLSCPSKWMVPAGGVAELFHEVGQHGLEHARIHGGGGMVVHVDGQLHAVGSRRTLLLGRGLQIDTHGDFLLPLLKSRVVDETKASETK